MKKTLIRPPKIYYNEKREPYIIYNNKEYSLKGYTNKEIIDILNKLKNRKVNIEDIDKNKIVLLINEQIKQYLKEKKTQPQGRRGYMSYRRPRQTNDKLNNTKSQIKELIELLKLQLITKKDINEEIKINEDMKKYINDKMKDVNKNYKAIEDKETIEKKNKIKEEEDYYNKIINDQKEDIKKIEDYKEDLILNITKLKEDVNINLKEIDNYRKIKNNLDNQISSMTKFNKELLKDNTNIQTTNKNLFETIKKLDNDNKKINLSINNKIEELNKIENNIKEKEKENILLKNEKDKIKDELKQEKDINKKIIERQKNKIMKQDINKEIIDKNINNLENINNQLNKNYNELQNNLNKLVNDYNNVYKEKEKNNFININNKLNFNQIEKKYIENGILKKDELLKKFNKAKSGKALYDVSQEQLLKYIYDKIPKKEITIDEILKEDVIKEKKRVDEGEKKVKKSSAQRLREFKESSKTYKQEEEQQEEEKQEEEQNGEGKKDNDEGLTDIEINNFMEPYRIYIKTISRDELYDMINYIIDNNIYKCCFIMNTLNRDDNNDVGHWQAFFICLEEPYYSIEFFDSYGTKPDYKIIDKFKYMLNRMKIPTFIKFKYNKIKQQYNNTSTCGIHCLLFLIKRIYNISFKDATNYNKTIKETEDDAIKFKEFYEHFKLI